MKRLAVLIFALVILPGCIIFAPKDPYGPGKSKDSPGRGLKKGHDKGGY